MRATTNECNTTQREPVFEYESSDRRRRSEIDRELVWPFGALTDPMVAPSPGKPSSRQALHGIRGRARSVLAGQRCEHRVEAVGQCRWSRLQEIGDDLISTIRLFRTAGPARAIVNKTRIMVQ